MAPFLDVRSLAIRLKLHRCQKRVRLLQKKKYFANVNIPRQKVWNCSKTLWFCQMLIPRLDRFDPFTLKALRCTCEAYKQGSFRLKKNLNLNSCTEKVRKKKKCDSGPNNNHSRRLVVTCPHD